MKLQTFLSRFPDQWVSWNAWAQYFVRQNCPYELACQMAYEVVLERMAAKAVEIER